MLLEDETFDGWNCSPRYIIMVHVHVAIVHWEILRCKFSQINQKLVGKGTGSHDLETTTQAAWEERMAWYLLFAHA